MREASGSQSPTWSIIQGTEPPFLIGPLYHKYIGSKATVKWIVCRGWGKVRGRNLKGWWWEERALPQSFLVLVGAHTGIQMRDRDYASWAWIRKVETLFLSVLHCHTLIAVGLKLHGMKGQKDSGEYPWVVLGGGVWWRKPLRENLARLKTWKVRRDQLGKEHGRQLNQAEEKHVKRPRVQQGHHVFKETEEARVA